MWDFSVIKDLLMNPVYTGAIASQKKDYRFKIGTIGEKKPEDWIVVEGLVFVSEENKKSEPFSYREKVRIFMVWCTSRDSNPGPTD